LLETWSFLEQDVAEITPHWEVHLAYLNIAFVLSRTDDREIATSTSRTRLGKIIIHPKIRSQAWYLSGYLSGEGFERYYFSKGWVFSGWIGFSQWFKKEFGIYPPKEMLVELGRMSKAEREEHTWFGVYLWERKHSKGRN